MKPKIKYNLTIWQRIALPFLWFIWAGVPVEDRKTWHEVKKGMEKHEHKYTEFFMYKGVPFYRCSHEGCTMCDTNI